MGPMTTPNAPLLAHLKHNCPACSDYADWIDHHCYACGEPFPDEAAVLMARLSRADQELTDAEMARLNELTAEHARCFE